MFALGIAAVLPAAQPVSFKGTNVKYRDYFDPPNQSQLRAVVTGAEVVPDGENRVRMKNVHIETFREDGEPEGVITAPDCVYDRVARVASSPGPIQARTADGKLNIAGEGFSVIITNKSLTISNNVRTVIRDLGTTPKKP